MTYSLHIAYGSESGNAHLLSYNLKRDLMRFNPNYSELNEVKLNQLTSTDLLLIITSTTGDGDAPSNASGFYRRLVQQKESLSCQFAVFGLGDERYDNFCGFSIVVDGLLEKHGATRLLPRVDANVDFEESFDVWCKSVIELL